MLASQILPRQPDRLSRPVFGSFAATFTQAGGYSQTVTIHYRVINRIVTLVIPSFQASATAAATIASGATDLPSGLRPFNNQICPVQVRDNGAILTTPGLIVLQANGQMVVSKDFKIGTAFTNASTCGLGTVDTPPYDNSITYCLDG